MCVRRFDSGHHEVNRRPAPSQSVTFRWRPLLALCLLLVVASPVIALPQVDGKTVTKEDVVNTNKAEKETVLSRSDFENAPSHDIDLTELGIHVPADPTMGDKAEGDIALPNTRRFLDERSGLGRNAIRQSYRYLFFGNQYGAYSRSVIAKAMNEYHSKTCVRFVPRDLKRHRDYVYIHPDDGCYSLVGRVGGRQPLSLDSGCIQTGTIVHELMHTVGFFHEQSRFDRDSYIDIVWPNVINGADDQFEKYGMNVIDQLQEEYDYASIMHYGPYAFSSNGKRTIVARKPGAQKMGQRVAFSDIDLRKINRLYACSSTATRPTSPTTTTGGGGGARAIGGSSTSTAIGGPAVRPPQLPSTSQASRYMPIIAGLRPFGVASSYRSLRPAILNTGARWASRGGYG